MTTEKGLRMLTDTDTHELELDYREGDGLEVTLVWYPDRDAIAVKVLDVRTGERLEIPVHPASAGDAFQHPFAYADLEALLDELPAAA
jgi:hypothetical protein